MRWQRDRYLNRNSRRQVCDSITDRSSTDEGFGDESSVIIFDKSPRCRVLGLDYVECSDLTGMTRYFTKGDLKMSQ